MGDVTLNGGPCSACSITNDGNDVYTASVMADDATTMGWLEFNYTITDSNGDQSSATSRIPVVEVLTVPFEIFYATNGARVSAVTAGANTFCGAAATGKTSTTSCSSVPDISAPTSWSGSVTLEFSLGRTESVCSVNSPNASMTTISANDIVSVYFTELVGAPANTTITMGDPCP